MVTKTPDVDIDRSKLKDKMGRYVTQSLFYETAQHKEYVCYTLKEEDLTLKNGQVLPSIKRLYLEFIDPTEYLFATACFASWAHWKKITRAKILEPYIEDWRAELDYKIRAIGLRELIMRAQTDTSSTAARFLATGGWKPKRKAGAPSKKEKEGYLKEEKEKQDEFDKDYERIEKMLGVKDDVKG